MSDFSRIYIIPLGIMKEDGKPLKIIPDFMSKEIMSDKEKLTDEERNKRIDETMDNQPWSFRVDDYEPPRQGTITNLDKPMLRHPDCDPKYVYLLPSDSPIVQEAKRYERYLQMCMFIQGGGTLVDQKAISEFGELSREFGKIDEEDEPMTLERAVEVLNERKHNDRTNWTLFTDFVASATPSYDPEDLYNLTEFEAVAIAEKYLREQK